MSSPPVTRVVLYKHGVGYFERQGSVEGDVTLSLTFKQSEVSDVLKSLTVLDLDGGHIASVSYDSTKPLEQLLAEVALSIPDEGSLVGLLPQIKTPVLIGWVMREFVFDRHFLAEWERRFPKAEVHRFLEAGHYVLEDEAARLVPLVRAGVAFEDGVQIEPQKKRKTAVA